MIKTIIKNEDDALLLLKECLAGAEVSPGDIKFEGWPDFNLHVVGPKYHQSITPSVMNGFIELQKEVYKAYALARYNTFSTNKLTNDERKELEFTVEVEDGSSGFEINIQELLYKFVELTATKMEPTHIVITLLGTALLYFGSSAFKTYLDNRQRTRELELKSVDQKEMISSLKFLSEEETKRAKIISDLAKNDYRVGNLEKSSYDAHTSLVKSLKNAQDVDLLGAELDGNIAEILTQNARRKSEDIRIDGAFDLLSVDCSRLDVFKVTVQDCKSKEIIIANVQDSALSNANKKTLQNAEWNHEPVKLKINAKIKGEKIHSAVILEVESLAAT